MNNEIANNPFRNRISLGRNIRFKANDLSLRTSSLNPNTVFSGLSRQFKIINSCLSILEATRKKHALHLPWLVRVNCSSDQRKVPGKKSKLIIRKQYGKNLYSKLLKRVKDYSPKSEQYKIIRPILKKEILLTNKDNFSPSCMKLKYNYRNKTLNNKDIRLITKSVTIPETLCENKSAKRSIVFSSIAPIHDESKSSSSSDSETSYNPILNPKLLRNLDEQYNKRVRHLLNPSGNNSFQ